MSDADTRDVALDARSSARSAHHRLDAINGSIDGLRTSHEKMRADFALRNEKLVEDFSVTTLSLVRDLATLRTTLSNALRVAAVVVSLVITIAAGVTVYAVTHMHHAAPTQATTTNPH